MELGLLEYIAGKYKKVSLNVLLKVYDALARKKSMKNS